MAVNGLKWSGRDIYYWTFCHLKCNFQTNRKTTFESMHWVDREKNFMVFESQQCFLTVPLYTCWQSVLGHSQSFWHCNKKPLIYWIVLCIFLFTTKFVVIFYPQSIFLFFFTSCIFLWSMILICHVFSQSYK